MHDSWAISFERKKDKFDLCLNDFAGRCFCEAFADFRGVKVRRKDCVMPVILSFKGVREHNLLQLNGNEKMLPVSVKKFGQGLGQFLYDEVSLLEPDRIEIGFLFSTYARKYYELLLEVKAGRLEFIDQQKEAFVALFGNEAEEYFVKYHEARSRGLIYDYESSLAFLEGRDLVEAQDANH